MPVINDMITGGRQDCSDLHSWGPGVRTCYVLHYIIKGKGTFLRGDKSYKLSAGESFVIRPFDNVAYYPDAKEPWEYAWLDFNGERYTSLLNKLRYSRDNCITGAIEAEKIVPLFDIIKGINPSVQKNTARGVALAILGIYADTFENREKSVENACFDSARLLIDNNFYKSDFDISVICASLGISRATLHRCFIKVCGISPGAYISKYRLDRAKEFLMRGFSVKSAAFSCGFSDSLYFSKVFKREEGISPGRYRREKAVNE